MKFLIKCNRETNTKTKMQEKHPKRRNKKKIYQMQIKKAIAKEKDKNT